MRGTGLNAFIRSFHVHEDGLVLLYDESPPTFLDAVRQAAMIS